MLHRTQAVFVAMSSLLVSVPARGELTKITTAEGPVLMGPRNYTAEDDGAWPILSYKWEMKCLMPGAITSEFVAIAGNAKNIDINATHYDGHRIRCTATYGRRPMPNSPAPPGPTSKEIDINVVRPNKTIIKTGLNTPVTRQQKVRITFEIYYNDISYLRCLGWPQEYAWLTKPRVEELGWLPETRDGLDPTKYTRDGPNILDWKVANLLDEDWIAIDINNVFVDYSQQNRLVISDCTGATDYIPLTKHKLRYRKKNDTQWIIEEY